jgi:hypothetical protein
MSLKDLLSKPCNCEEKTAKCCDFQSLKTESISVLNDIAKENASLRKQLEESKIQLGNCMKGEKGRENGIIQLNSFPEPFEPHPAKGKVPIRKTGRNGRKWEEYRDRLVDVFGIYEDVACVAISEMMEQGFTDHDIVDALFAPASGGRRFSTHNAGPCALPLIGDSEEGS